MKTKFKKQRGILFVVLGILMMTACQNEDAIATEEVALDDQLALRSVEIDLISDNISAVVEEVYQQEESTILGRSSQNAENPPGFLPDCVTITTVVTSTSKEKTIDFGTGCQLPNGNVLSGIIYMSYAIDVDVTSRTIAVGFTNFYMNNVNVEGEKSIERLQANAAGNPQSTAQVDLQVTWPDASYATRQGTKIREWIEGVGTGNWGDNVFLITGNATTTGRLGNTHAADITDALRRELACQFIVSGTVILSRNDASGTLFFGDGSCDNEATWTNPNGDTQTIYLN